jgi:hypothetical protein
MRHRDPFLVYLKINMFYDPIRKEPRFQAIERASNFSDRFESVLVPDSLSRRSEALMKIALIVAISALMPGAPVLAQPASPQRACFFINEFRNWKAPDARTIFIRVGGDRIYRLDLAANCALLTFPDAHLITRSHGSETICSALDWDLRVSQSPPSNAPEACIVKTMTLLTPPEAAAIPPKFRP